MSKIFFFLGLVSIATASLVTYSYSSGGCSGTPTSAEFFVLDKCIKNSNNPSVSQMRVNNDGVVSLRSYQTSDCSGTFTTSSTAFVNNCTLVLLSGSRISRIESAFSTAPGTSDTVTVNYADSNCFPTSVYSGSVEYADSCSASKVELCSNSDRSGNPSSSQVICGAGFSLPNSGNSIAVAFTLILSIIAFLF
eukprot:TRINITY_DN5233_c2_g1_i2.p1 TRINITY_DN5233_c2_g1~~TRINITY_DN5233_c2_g1_i2.p1  ORF type:complete len:193 (-),score=65.55 TRINITY_DN5233_c2_g1_i2:72-650(-)